MAELAQIKAIVVGPEAEAPWFGGLCKELGLHPERCTPEEALRFLQEHAYRTALVVYAGSAGEALKQFRASLPEPAAPIPFVVSAPRPDGDDSQLLIRLKVSAWIAPGSVPLPGLFQEITKRRGEVSEELELRQGFLTDAEGLVEELETLAVGLDPGVADGAAFARIYACAHTIKGASGFFQPDLIHRYTHRFEDYLSSLKPRLPAISAAEISLILAAIDQMKALLKEFAAGGAHGKTLSDLSKIFEQKVDAAPAPSEVVAPSALNSGGKAAPAAAANAPEELRVRLSLINEFIEQSGEITVLRNMLDSTFRQIEAARGTDPEISMLSKLLLELHKNVSGMQDRLGELKKVPFGKVVRPLERTVKELAGTLGKDVNFEIEGSENRIDTSIADLLSRCLIHLVRNSLDHGLENPAARTAAGKAATGRLSLRCLPTSDQVRVILSDDGRGIDPVIVRRKAVEKGILSEREAAALPDSEAQALIFAPGFSTAAEVSDVSGRGVGTDMVKGSVLAFGGKLHLDSVPGRGTTFELIIPVPKAVHIVDCLFVRLRGEVFAVPFEGVERIIDLETPGAADRLTSAAGTPFWREEDTLVPIIDGAGILSLPPRAAPREGRGLVVLLRSRRMRYGIFVDEVLDNAESVVKRLDLGLAREPAYLGATFLSDARVALVLSAEGLATSAGLKEKTPARAEEARAAEQPRWLLFRAGDTLRFAAPESAVIRADLRSRSEAFLHGGRTFFRFGPTLAREVALGEASTDFLLFVRVGEKVVALAVQEILEFTAGPAPAAFNDSLPWEHGRVVRLDDQVVHLFEPEYFVSEEAA